MDLLERLFNPPWVFSVIPLLIASALYWYWFRPRKRIAMKRRAELLVKFLKDILEPELYETLKNLVAYDYILGVTPGRATFLYEVFEELGGMKVLRLLPQEAAKCERTLVHLAGKFGLAVRLTPRGEVRAQSRCKHPIEFISRSW